MKIVFNPACVHGGVSGANVNLNVQQDWEPLLKQLLRLGLTGFTGLADQVQELSIP